MASSNNRLSREESKKAKEIEEMRKAGTLAPDVDEDGNMINPHIPLYMSQAPWYLNATEGVGLKFQKDNKDRSVKQGSAARGVADNWQQNKKGVGKGRDEFGVKINPHKGRRKRGEVEEVEAPRDTGYDESFDGKHDRWNGWDNSQYKEVIDRYEKIEAERRKKKAQEVDEKFKRNAMRKEEKKKKKEAKRKLKEKKLAEKQAKASEGEGTDSDSDSDSDSDDSDSDDDDMKMTEDISLGAGFDNHEGGSKGIRTTVRNLRIREDTAKYLYNLDPSSAYYDPKTRSMRADPRPHLDAKDKLYAGDNMRKATGETGDFTDEQLYAWEASQRGQNLTMEAAPSAAHFMHKKFQGKKESLADRQKRLLAEKYGNAAAEAPDTALLLGQSEQYVEYGRDGRVIKGEDKVVPKTKYAEDVHLGNHSAVWGSWYDKNTRRWGFSCCQQTSRQAYCVPAQQQQQAISDAEAMPPPPAMSSEAGDADIQQPGEMLEVVKLSKKEQREKEKKEKEESDERLAKALAREKKLAKKKKGGEDDDDDDKKRKYNSMKSTDVTDEDMEAYKMAKLRDDDPMAKFL